MYQASPICEKVQFNGNLRINKTSLHLGFELGSCLSGGTSRMGRISITSELIRQAVSGSTSHLFLTSLLGDSDAS